MEFKVGDIITGRPGDDRYTITNANMYKGEVIAVDSSKSSDIKVEILEHSDKSEVGHTHWVNSGHFLLVNGTSGFKVGDIVKGKPNNGYSRTNKDMTKGKVIGVKPGTVESIMVEIVEHADRSLIGLSYWVNPSSFERIDEKASIKLTPTGTFKIGDFIRAKDMTSPYSFTNRDMTRGKVIDVAPSKNDDIYVEVLDHKNPASLPYVKKFWVSSKYFELIGEKTEETPKAFKVGDFVKGLAEPGKYAKTSKYMSKGIVERVSSTDKDSIYVKILEHPDESYIGEGYWVDPKYFEKYKSDIKLKESKKDGETILTPKFKVGDRVKLITPVPHHGSGGVRLGDEGTVTLVKDVKVCDQIGYKVNFEKCVSWNGLENELKLVVKFPYELSKDLGGGTIVLEAFGFKAGDRVKHRAYGAGTVRLILTGRGNDSIGVEFDNSIPSGHEFRYVGDAVDIKGKNGHCWFCTAESLTADKEVALKPAAKKTEISLKPKKEELRLVDTDPRDPSWDEEAYPDDDDELDEESDEPSFTLTRRDESMASDIKLRERGKAPATGVALKSKERGGIMKGFGKLFGDIQIGKDTSGRLALSPMGMAVLNNEGKWVAFDGTALVDVMDVKFDIDNAFYRVPTMDIKAKDVIINQSGVPVIVAEVAADAIKVINPQNGLRETIVPQTNLFNMKFYVKILNLFGDTFGKMDLKKPESLLPFMLLGDSDGDMGDMLPLMLMMNGGFGGGDMNSMLPLMLLSKGGDMGDMLPLLLMSQGGAAGEMGNMLPFLLLSKDGGKDDMLTTMLMMNAMGGKGFNLFGAKAE